MPLSQNPFPSARIELLKTRSALTQQVRQFFWDRGFWEADTPLLSAETVIDAHIDPIEVSVENATRYLQTSPELAMKRLLAAGSGSIFQLTHAFRAGESGPRHNREFTLLEWYRVGADLIALMNEVRELVQKLTPLVDVHSTTYRDAFTRAVRLDPFRTSDSELLDRCRAAGLSFTPTSRDDLLNFLWADQVEPSFSPTSLVFVHHYPASQAALAEVVIDEHGDHVAERFELYAGGVELANGYHELRDPAELSRRFETQNHRRRESNKNPFPNPNRLLAAMEHGLPRCSGVAVGFDRLIMLALNKDSIRDVIAFPDDFA
jgi:lysyl-tRNA synthetase class 2